MGKAVPLTDAIDEASERKDGKRELRILDPKEGDIRLGWDKDNEADVEEARKSFNSAKKRGLAAFRVGPGGKKSTSLAEFDPEAEAIIMAPPLVGG